LTNVCNSFHIDTTSKTQDCCPQVCNAQLLTADCCCCCYTHSPLVLAIYGVADWRSELKWVGLNTGPHSFPVQKGTSLPVRDFVLSLTHKENVTSIEPSTPKIAIEKISTIAMRFHMKYVLRFLWPPYGMGQAIIFSCCDLFFFFFFFSSPNLSGRRLDVYHTSAHGVALV